MWTDLLDSAIIISVLASTLRIATPLLLAAMGELVAERAGVYNMGLEGTMLMGAFVGWLAAHESGSNWVGIAAAAGAGATMGLILAVMVVTLAVEQIVTGLALNLLASGLTTFWLRAAFAGESSLPAVQLFETVPIPVLASIPFIGPVLFEQKALTYLALASVPLIWLLLYRTRPGLELMVLGENPRALDIKGLSVAGRQFAAIIFGGAMAGVGGAFLSLASAARFVPDMVNGRGWLALVIVIAGLWRPAYILIAALAFSFLDALQLQIQGVGIAIPYQLLLALPYVVAIIALMLRRKRAVAPAMLGQAYRREADR